LVQTYGSLSSVVLTTGWKRRAPNVRSSGYY